MKKITIALPEEMIKEVHKLAEKMGKQDFWTLAITWRQLIKKGLAYFEKETGKKKKGSSKTKDSEEPRDQKQYTPIEMEPVTNEEVEKALREVYPENKK